MKHIKHFENTENDNITSDKIKDLGYDKEFIASDGGTKQLVCAKRGARSWFTIQYAGDNFILKQRNDPNINRIKIIKTSWPEEADIPTEEILFDDIVTKMSELEGILINIKVVHKIRE